MLHENIVFTNFKTIVFMFESGPNERIHKSVEQEKRGHEQCDPNIADAHREKEKDNGERHREERCLKKTGDSPVQSHAIAELFLWCIHECYK